jgi:hypothetical protein
MSFDHSGSSVLISRFEAYPSRFIEQTQKKCSPPDLHALRITIIERRPPGFVLVKSPMACSFPV